MAINMHLGSLMFISCRFVLGESPPVISNVSSFRDNRHDEDWAVAIECDITWESKMVILC